LENSTSMGPKAQALSSPASGVRPTISSTSSSSSPAPPRPPSPPAGLLPFDPFPEQETAQTPAANMTAAQLTDLIMALLMTHAPANDRDSEATPSLRRQEQRKASRAGKIGALPVLLHAWPSAGMELVGASRGEDFQ